MESARFGRSQQEIQVAYRRPAEVASMESARFGRSQASATIIANESAWIASMESARFGRSQAGEGRALWNAVVAVPQWSPPGLGGVRGAPRVSAAWSGRLPQWSPPGLGGVSHGRDTAADR